MDFFEFIKDFTDSAKDRIKTPITGSFTLAFIVYNWRPLLLLLFSKATIEEKITIINADYCSVWAIIGPLLIAVIYVAAVPYIMMGLEKMTGVALVGRKEHKSNQKLKDLQLQEGIYAQEFKNTQIKSGNRDMEQLNDRNDSLQIQVEELNTLLKNSSDSNHAIIEEFQRKENDDKVRIEQLTLNVNDMKFKLSSILNETGVQSVLNELVQVERDAYVDFYNFYILRRADKTITTPLKYIERFIELNLIYEDVSTGDYFPTEIGKLTHSYLFY